jgi:hypothetical protein
LIRFNQCSFKNYILIKNDPAGSSFYSSSGEDGVIGEEINPFPGIVPGKGDSGVVAVGRGRAYLPSVAFNLIPGYDGNKDGLP